ncbi:MAG: hypothetical protein LAO20_18665 [Acidobacteriia bacterium]|nr:hypothetical protein [Terriglobia bacterium]
MPQSNVNGLTEQEQRELLRLLEEEQEYTLVIIHSIPRPRPLPGQTPPDMTPDGKHYVLRIPITSK